MSDVKKINMVFLITVLTSIVASNVNGLLYGSMGESGTLVLMLVTQVMLILPAAGYLFINKLNLKETIRLRGIKISNVILLIIFSFLITPLMSLINMISMLFVENVIQNTMTEIADHNSLIAAVTTIALIPCIFEETVYRGVFYNGYRKVNVLKGMVLSAFLFGIMHMNFNQFFYAFVMGMMFIILIEATDTILAPMIVHFCINAGSVFNLYLLPELEKMIRNISPEYTAQMEQSAATELTKSDILNAVPAFALWTVFTLALAWIVLKCIAKNCGRYDYLKSIFKVGVNQRFLQTKTEEVQIKTGLISVPIVAGIIICICIMIINEVL